ncbi:MAG: hypothetical protein WBF17_07395 [Phycisphaerae bacterium]
MAEADEAPSMKRRAIEMGVLVLLVVAFLIVSLIRQNPFRQGADVREAIGIIIGAGLTLIMYSFLYRDNPLFKVAENLYVGVTLGYLFIITWRESLWGDVFGPIFTAPTGGAFAEAIVERAFPIVLGLLLLTRLSRKHGWLSRYAYAWMVGWGAGIGIAVVTNSFILEQLRAAVSPLQAAVGGAAGAGAAPDVFSWPWFRDAALPIIWAVVVLVGTVAVLFYFFFSIEHRRAGGVVSRVGVWFLMISFGASFGYTVMGRLSLLIGRVRFLLFEWLRLPQ